MGLTLGDGAAGEVIVDDVAVGSMAAQLGLLPGAALVALNEVSVAGLTRKAVIMMIGKAKRPLTLHVRPGVVPGVVTHPSAPAGSRAVVGAVEVAKGDAKDGGSPSTARTFSSGSPVRPATRCSRPPPPHEGSRSLSRAATSRPGTRRMDSRASAGSAPSRSLMVSAP